MSQEFPPPTQKKSTGEIEVARGLFFESLREVTDLNLWLKQYRDTIMKMVEQGNSAKAVDLLNRKKSILKNEDHTEKLIKELENLIQSIEYYTEEMKKAPHELNIQADSIVIPAPEEEIHTKEITASASKNKRPRIEQKNRGTLEKDTTAGSISYDGGTERLSENELKQNTEYQHEENEINETTNEISKIFDEYSNTVANSNEEQDKLKSRYQIKKFNVVEEEPLPPQQQKVISTHYPQKPTMPTLEDSLSKKSLDALKNAVNEKSEEKEEQKVSKQKTSASKTAAPVPVVEPKVDYVSEMEKLGASKELLEKARTVATEDQEEMLGALKRKVERSKIVTPPETFEQKKNPTNPINPEIAKRLEAILTPEMIEKIKTIFDKKGLKVVVHGADHTFYETNPKTGKPDKTKIIGKGFVPKADIDGKTAAYLLGQAGLDLIGTSFVEKGQDKRKHIPEDSDTELGNEREWKTGEGDIYLDTGGQGELISIRDGKLFFDNHQPEKGPHTSSTQILDYVLEKLGRYNEETNRAAWKDNLLRATNDIDNMDLHGKGGKDYILNEWPQTLEAISSELSDKSFSTYIDLFKQGLTGREKLPEEIQNTEIKDGLSLKDIIEQKKKQTETALHNVKNATKEMLNGGMSQIHPLLGKILVHEQAGKTKIERREVAHAIGIDTIITTYPEQKDVNGKIVSHGGLFISSPKKDVSVVLEAVKKIAPTAQVVRGSIVLAFPEDKTISKEEFYKALGLSVEKKGNSNESQSGQPEAQTSIESTLESLKIRELELADKIVNHTGTADERYNIIAEYRQLQEYKKHIESGSTEKFNFSFETHIDKIVDKMRPEWEKEYEETERINKKKGDRTLTENQEKINPSDLLENLSNKIKEETEKEPKNEALKPILDEVERSLINQKSIESEDTKRQNLQKKLEEKTALFRETISKTEKAEKQKKKLVEEIAELRKKGPKNGFRRFFSRIPKEIQKKEYELIAIYEQIERFTKMENDLSQEIENLEKSLENYTDQE